MSPTTKEDPTVAKGRNPTTKEGPLGNTKDEYRERTNPANGRIQRMEESPDMEEDPKTPHSLVSCSGNVLDPGDPGEGIRPEVICIYYLSQM